MLYTGDQLSDLSKEFNLSKHIIFHMFPITCFLFSNKTQWCFDGVMMRESKFENPRGHSETKAHWSRNR
jgi:hypothetical protein